MVESLDPTVLLESLGDVFDRAVQCSEEQGWEEYASEGNFVAFRKYIEGGAIAIKVEIYVDTPPKALADHLFLQAAHAAKKHQPDLIESSEVVRTFDEETILLHDKILPQGPVSAREIYIFSAKRVIDDDKVVITSFSPAGLPTTEGYVQANVDFSLYLFETVGGDSNKTKFTVTTSTDPKGSIPQFIVNSVAGNRANFFRALVAEYLATH
jgi:hypothetical protein